MTEREIHQVMTYIFADSDALVRPEKRKVWLDQFGHIPLCTGMAAAKLLLTRKMFGPPRVHDFAEAIAEVTATASDVMTWGEAWGLVMAAVGRFGGYRVDEAIKTLPPNVASSIGDALGFRELCNSDEDSLPTQRAQFRQRYEALVNRGHQTRILSPDLAQRLEANRKGKPLLDSTLALLGNKNGH